MTVFRERYEDRTLDRLRSLRAAFLIIPDPLRDLWGCAVLTDGGIVLLSDQKKCGNADVAEFINNGLDEDHVRRQSLAPSKQLAVFVLIHAREHVYPFVVLGLPFAGVIGLAFVIANAVCGR